MAGSSFRVKFDGLEELIKKLDKRPEDILRGAKGALYVEAEQTITDAKKLTPVDEGVLRASGHVQLPRGTPGGFEIELGFGGPAGTGNIGTTNPEDVGYAVHVHEDLTAFHTVGQAKYLEVPLNQRKSGFAERIAKRIKDRLGVV